MTTSSRKFRAGCWACCFSIVHPFVADIPTDELPDTKQKEAEEGNPRPRQRQKAQEIGRTSTDRIDVDRAGADCNDTLTGTYLNIAIAIAIDIGATFAVDTTER